MHDKLNAILKRIEQDCTFNQSRFLEVIPKGPYYSLDLTAATDRMPIAVQRRVISLVFGRIQSFA